MAVMTLVALGLVMVYSASAITAQEKLGDGFYYLKRQAAAAGLGLLAMTLALRIGYRRLARLVYPLLVCVLVLLVVVLLPAVGTTVGGARRWIRLLGFSIQPAEIAKLAWVLYLAYSLAKKRERVALFSAGFRKQRGDRIFALHSALCGGNQAVLSGRIGAIGNASRLPGDCVIFLSEKENSRVLGPVGAPPRCRISGRR